MPTPDRAAITRGMRLEGPNYAAVPPAAREKPARGQLVHGGLCAGAFVRKEHTAAPVKFGRPLEELAAEREDLAHRIESAKEKLDALQTYLRQAQTR